MRVDQDPAAASTGATQTQGLSELVARSTTACVLQKSQSSSYGSSAARLMPCEPQGLCRCPGERVMHPVLAYGGMACPGLKAKRDPEIDRSAAPSPFRCHLGLAPLSSRTEENFVRWTPADPLSSPAEKTTLQIRRPTHRSGRRPSLRKSRQPTITFPRELGY